MGLAMISLLFFNVSRPLRLRHNRKQVKGLVESRNYFPSDAKGLAEAMTEFEELVVLRKIDPKLYSRRYKECSQKIKVIHDRLEHGLR